MLDLSWLSSWILKFIGRKQIFVVQIGRFWNLIGLRKRLLFVVWRSTSWIRGQYRITWWAGILERTIICLDSNIITWFTLVILFRILNSLRLMGKISHIPRKVHLWLNLNLERIWCFFYIWRRERDWIYVFCGCSILNRNLVWNRFNFNWTLLLIWDTNLTSVIVFLFFKIFKRSLDSFIITVKIEGSLYGSVVNNHISSFVRIFFLASNNFPTLHRVSNCVIILQFGSFIIFIWLTLSFFDGKMVLRYLSLRIWMLSGRSFNRSERLFIVVICGW